MSDLNFKVEGDIGFIEFNQAGSKVNVLSSSVMAELSKLIASLKNKPQVKALLITSAKENIFIAGADIKEIENISSAKEAKAKADEGKGVLDDLASLDLITIAVINGACLGGGFELALACDYRVAGFGDKIKIGLPEVKLGVLPGFGGTVRLPRLLGLVTALNLILAGKMLTAKAALKIGAVDGLFSDINLLESSTEFAKKLISREKIIKRKKKKLLQTLLEDTSFGRSIIFKKAKATVLKKTKGFYPAPLKILDVISKTYPLNLKEGFKIESQAFSGLAVSEVAKNLIKIFYLFEEFKKCPWVETSIKPKPIDKTAVVGAGVMGGGIAQLISNYDIPVRIKDINYDSLKTALKTAYSIFKQSLKRRKIKKHDLEFKFGLISPTINYNGFKTSDLVIEAVVEDIDIKCKVFKELGEVTTPETVIASNTSALSILKMSQATPLSERVVGLHFFNPVHRMPLVEVIKSAKTSDETLATTIAFARKLSKVVIVVKDVPGFLVNRILLIYLNEAVFLLEQGMKIEEIDSLALNFGMPMGPLELIDEVGIDVGYKVGKILEDAYGPRMEVCNLLKEVKEKGLLGKKGGKGFYSHKGKKKIPNQEIYDFLQAKSSKPVSSQVALKRLLYIMVNEAARCLEEEVVLKPGVVDLGMITGTGFPPHRGGLLRYADSLGIETITKDLISFKSARFKPCDYLIKKSENKEKFYS
tara:strand:- start:1698 stop:3806 length:2109 start_codon:yes stop_codon:yes gene_type:complete